MLHAIRRLSLGLTLIALASAGLLVFDRGHRQSSVDGTKMWHIHVTEYVNVVDVEEAEKGVRDGLHASGLVEGHDYVLSVRNAQGDMATLNSLVDAALTEGADLLVPISTPTLQAAMQKARAL